MSSISVSLPSDGQTIDAADYNTPITTIVTDYNGNIDNSNIASAAAIAGSKLADGGITNAKLSTATGEIGAVWATWVPGYTGLSLGNGTLTFAKYTKVGKTIQFKLKVILGSTSAVSSLITISPPAAPHADYTTTPIGTVVGNANADNGSNFFSGVCIFDTSGNLGIYFNNAASTYAIPTASGASVPFSWGNTHRLWITGTYEAA